MIHIVFSNYIISKAYQPDQRRCVIEAMLSFWYFVVVSIRHGKDLSINWCATGSRNLFLNCVVFWKLLSKSSVLENDAKTLNTGYNATMLDDIVIYFHWKESDSKNDV